jgi:hypothetical protein
MMKGLNARRCTMIDRKKRQPERENSHEQRLREIVGHGFVQGRHKKCLMEDGEKNRRVSEK